MCLCRFTSGLANEMSDILKYDRLPLYVYNLIKAVVRYEECHKAKGDMVIEEHPWFCFNEVLSQIPVLQLTLSQVIDEVMKDLD
jgi:hypothetical protein